MECKATYFDIQNYYKQGGKWNNIVCMSWQTKTLHLKWIGQIKAHSKDWSGSKLIYFQHTSAAII